MSKEKEKIQHRIDRTFRNGYQPTEGKMDTSNPPKGGSGVPPKNTHNRNNQKE